MTTEVAASTSPAFNALPTADELLRGWHGYAGRQLKPRILKDYESNIRRFIKTVGSKPLAVTTEADIWSFVDAEFAACGNLRRQNLTNLKGYECGAGLFQREASPPPICSATCAKFRSKNPLLILHALKAVSSFYKFLVRRGHVQSNFLPFVLRDFAKDFPPANYLIPRRKPTVTEARRLVLSTLLPCRRAIYMLLPKTGFRIHELLLLTTDTDCVDLEKGVLRIPMPLTKSEPNKRKGKRLGFIDDELRFVLMEYIKFREQVLHRIPADKRPRRFFLGETGKPLTDECVNEWIREDATRIGLVKDYHNHAERITAHSFRHTFTTALFQNGCPEHFIRHLRGDRIRDVTGVYYDPSENELQAAYLRYFPAIGV